MKRLVLALAALGLAACGGPAAPPGKLLQSAKARITTAPPQTDIDAVVGGNTAFGLDVFNRLAPSGNALVSPYSIDAAFGMLYGGARNGTATAFEQTFHISVPAATFHRVMNHVDLQLADRAKTGKARDGGPLKLNVANQLFTQDGFALQPDYLDLLSQEYGAGVATLDFEHQAEDARLKINDWVANRTEDKIKDLFGKGVINPDTRLVLVNALYLDAAWSKTFDESKTHDAPFHLAEGGDATVKMMQNPELKGRHALVDQTEVVELPYSGDQLALDIVMPPALSDLEPVDDAKLASLLGQLGDTPLDLSMPRFTLKSKYSLDDALKAMGLSVAYTADADFSGITGDRSLFIQGSVHQTFGDVSEKGTEAAAATGISVGTTSVGPSAVKVVIDHPFLFVLRDKPTGQVLFIGRFTHP